MSKRGYIRIPLSGSLDEELLPEIRREAEERAERMHAVIIMEVGEQHRTFMGVPMYEYVFRIQAKQVSDDVG